MTSKIGRYRFTYIFVDDGSNDKSLYKAEELAQEDSKITVVELSRNFGKEIALTAGIDMLDCDAVIIGTPIDLTRCIDIDKPTVRVNYELQEIGSPTLKDVLKELLT